MGRLPAKGIASAIGAYLLWGMVPLYWGMLRHVDALEVLAYRILWSLVFLLFLVVASRRAGELRRILRSGEVVYPLGLTALLISVNWYLYIWAVSHGFVLETSLGYFINPLVSVVLGTAFLGERLRAMQKVAVGLTAGAVLYLVVALGRPPWIALSLALTFALYGMFKKKGTAGAMVGLATETAIAALPSLLIAIAASRDGGGAFRSDTTTALLLVGGGVVTSLPLLLFGAAARELPLTVLGFCQYLSPTVQFLLAVFFFREAFTRSHAVAFGLIWAAIALFVIDAVRAGARSGGTAPRSSRARKALRRSGS